MTQFTISKMRKCKAEGYICSGCEWLKLCIRSKWRCDSCEKGATYRSIFNVVFGRN